MLWWWWELETKPMQTWLSGMQGALCIACEKLAGQALPPAVAISKLPKWSLHWMLTHLQLATTWRSNVLHSYVEMIVHMWVATLTVVATAFSQNRISFPWVYMLPLMVIFVPTSSVRQHWSKIQQILSKHMYTYTVKVLIQCGNTFELTCSHWYYPLMLFVLTPTLTQTGHKRSNVHVHSENADNMIVRTFLLALKMSTDR